MTFLLYFAFLSHAANVCKPSEFFYWGMAQPCGPSARCSIKWVGDKKCHKICLKNEDCPSEQSCKDVQLFSGDVIEFDGKLCR